MRIICQANCCKNAKIAVALVLLADERTVIEYKVLASYQRKRKRGKKCGLVEKVPWVPYE